MRWALRIYYGLHALARELMKFGVVGAVAFLVDVGVFNLALLVVELEPLTSKTVSVVAATTVAYAGNRAWTFRHRDHRGLRREYALFFAFNAIGLLIALLCLGFTFYVLGLRSALAQNIAANGFGLVLATAFRFWTYSRFVFPEAAAIALPDTGQAPARAGGTAQAGGTARAGATDGAAVDAVLRPAQASQASRGHRAS